MKHRVSMDGLLLKFSIVAVLALFLLIPLNLVMGLVRERNETRQVAISQIESTWAMPQRITGPGIRYSLIGKDPKTMLDYAIIYPALLKINVSASTKNLHRSIYETSVYASVAHIYGTFEIDQELTGRSPVFYVNLSDLKGIEGECVAVVAGKRYEFMASMDNRGIEFPIPAESLHGNIDFDIELTIKGAESFDFTPVAKLTEVTVKSDCAEPSFQGDFLPSEREVSEDGFTAKWVVSQINRGAPESTAFGVRIVPAANQYQQTTRSAKYGLLIIMMVFLACVISEFVTKKSIHYVQYVVIGLSLVLFYSLLLSFSEIIPFGFAYAVSAFMTTCSLSAYFKAIIKGKAAYVLGGLVAVSYVICYILLQMETYALLTGSLVLFVGLGALMYFTRNIAPETNIESGKQEIDTN